MNLISKYTVSSATPKTVTRNLLTVHQEKSRKYTKFAYSDGKAQKISSTYTLSLSKYTASSSSSSSEDASKVTTPQLRADNSHENVVEIVTDSGTYSGFIVGDHQIATCAEAVYDNSSGTISKSKVRTGISLSVYSDYKTAEVTDLTPTYIHVPNLYAAKSSTEVLYNYAILEVVEDLSDYGEWNLGVASDEFIDSKPVIELNGFENGKRYLGYGNVEILDDSNDNKNKVFFKNYYIYPCY